MGPQDAHERLNSRHGQMMTTSAFDTIDPPSPSDVDTCVHCGFCLPTCPTYLLWGEEMDSPRGRIYLMKAAAEGRSRLDGTFVSHMDRCLGCMACVTACPSGVPYGRLIEKTRGQIERHHPRAAGDRWFRHALFALLPYPSRLRLVLAPLALLGRGVRAIARTSAFRRLPLRLRALLTLAPPVTWTDLMQDLPERTPPATAGRRVVGLLAGCVQRVAFAPVNQATIRVLSAEGCEVRVPRSQGCCGALALHAGELDRARAFARRTIEAFDDPALERIVVNAAGCGSAMKEYGDLLDQDPAWAERARAFSAKVRDVSEALVELGPPQAPRHPIPCRVAYHDACHLAHAQGIRAAPRTLLASVPGLEVRTAGEAEICCGSAGIYNLVQPEAATALGARKVAHLAAVQPDVVATGNPGCTLQIAAAARAAGHDWAVLHPIEILDASIRGASPPSTGRWS
jgi:glycolate oxidase iron-sulfur subunit